jgi:prevent-host-death family protein
MPKTQVRPSRDLRNNYADLVRMLEQHDHIVITNNGVGESVLINIDDYEKYEEFLHHQFIYDELQKSKAEAENPNTKRYTHDEMLALLAKQREARSRA